MIVSQDVSGVTDPSPRHKLVNWVQLNYSRIFENFKKTKIRFGDFIGQNIGRVRKPETHVFVFLGLKHMFCTFPCLLNAAKSSSSLSNSLQTFSMRDFSGSDADAAAWRP